MVLGPLLFGLRVYALASKLDIGSTIIFYYILTGFRQVLIAELTLSPAHFLVINLSKYPLRPPVSLNILMQLLEEFIRIEKLQIRHLVMLQLCLYLTLQI